MTQVTESNRPRSMSRRHGAGTAGPNVRPAAPNRSDQGCYLDKRLAKWINWVSLGREVMMMKFVVKKGSNGQYRFNLVASNGQVVATSESYSRKTSALNTIASIRKNAADANVEDQTTDA